MNLSDYTDSYGRIHDKSTASKDYLASGNGWIYTAVAERLGVERKILRSVGVTCAKELKRHPYVYGYGNIMSPISRDEVLGLAYLGYLKSHDLNGWNFCPPDLEMPRFNPITLVKQLLEAKGQHRTYFWKNNLSQIYRFAFMVPFQDRHFLNQCWGRYNPIWHLVHIVNGLSKKIDRSARLIQYLKTGKDKEAVRNYFGDNHPLSSL
jgi:hypothetical protein